MDGRNEILNRIDNSTNSIERSILDTHNAEMSRLDQFHSDAIAGMRPPGQDNSNIPLQEPGMGIGDAIQTSNNNVKAYIADMMSSMENNRSLSMRGILKDLNDSIQGISETKNTTADGLAGVMQSGTALANDIFSLFGKDKAERNLNDSMDEYSAMKSSTDIAIREYDRLLKEKNQLDITNIDGVNDERIEELNEQLEESSEHLESITESFNDISEQLSNQIVDFRDMYDTEGPRQRMIENMDDDQIEYMDKAERDYLKNSLAGNTANAGQILSNNNDLLMAPLKGSPGAEPTTFGGGILSIHHELHEMNGLLKDGAGASQGGDSQATGGFGIGSLLSTMFSKFGGMMSKMGGFLSKGLTAMMPFVKNAGAFIARGLTAAAPILGPVLAAPMGLMIGNKLVESGALGQDLQRGVSIGDVFDAIVDGNSIADTNAKRVQALMEKEAEEQVKSSVNKQQLNADYKTTDKHKATATAMMEQFSEDSDVSDMPGELRNIFSAAKEAGVIEEHGTLWDDSITSKRLGIDNVEVQDLSHSDLVNIIKMTEIAGAGGLEAFDRESKNRLKKVDDQRAAAKAQQQKDKLESMKVNKSEAKDSLTVDGEVKSSQERKAQETEIMTNAMVAAQEQFTTGNVARKAREETANATGKQFHRVMG